MGVPSIFDPQKGTNISDEIKCYGLPYGALGFISHLLTYWTIGMLAAGRKPLPFWGKLKHSRFDLVFSIISLVGGFALTVFTMVRCRNHWQLLVIAIWKMSMAILNGLVGIHISVVIRNFHKRKEAARLEQPYYPRKADLPTTSPVPDDPDGTTEALWWIALYVPGMIVGLTGIISLIVRNWNEASGVHIVVYVFGGLMASAFVAFVFFWARLARDKGEPSDTIWFLFFYLSFGVLTVLSALFCDWSLGSLTHNLVGTPDSTSAGFYWTYFVVKRFTMLSF